MVTPTPQRRSSARAASPAPHCNRWTRSVIVVLLIVGQALVPTPVHAAPHSVADAFEVTTYGNNDGDADWVTDWIEINDDGSPTTGLVWIEEGELRLSGTQHPHDPAPAIMRTADLSGTVSATLTFTFHTVNVEPNDHVDLEISADGGTTWTRLERFIGADQGSRTYDIAAYRSAQTVIRFTLGNKYQSTDEYFAVESLGITYEPLFDYVAEKQAVLTGDVNGDGRFDIGDRFLYRLVITNVGVMPAPVDSLRVAEEVPTNTLYIRTSTRFYTATTPIDIPDTSGLPLAAGGITLPATLTVGSSFTLTYEVRINATLPDGEGITSVAHVSGLGLALTPEHDLEVAPRTPALGDRVWHDVDGNGAQDDGEPGLANVLLALEDGACTRGEDCLTTITDEAGFYDFPNLITGTYTVTVEAASVPSHLTPSHDLDGYLDGQTAVDLTGLTLPYGEADFGYKEKPTAVTLVTLEAAAPAGHRVAVAVLAALCLVVLVAAWRRTFPGAAR